MISVNFRLSFPTTGALISLLFSFLLAAPVLAQMSEAAPSIAKVLTLDDAIKDAVWNALTAKSPRLRYPVGKGIALSRMRRFVPASLFDKSFRKQFQLD
jgi:hypothetical protein